MSPSARTSAGILLYRRTPAGALEVLLAHMGGPFFAAKDEGAWSIPKGEYAEDEAPWDAARREFAEETGQAVDGDFVELAPLRQKHGKTIFCWMVEADLDLAAFASNTFEMEWPPRSGQQKQFPEIDRIGWFGLPAAMKKIIAYQRPFLVELQEKLA